MVKKTSIYVLRFSGILMKLFSYICRIEPLESMELYSFILPHFDKLDRIMQNIDYCVAATDYISECPTWLSRSNSFRSDVKKRY